MVGGETKPKLVYIAGCALILRLFAVEHIPTTGTALIEVISPMLKWDVIPQSKSFNPCKGPFLGLLSR